MGLAKFFTAKQPGRAWPNHFKNRQPRSPRRRILFEPLEQRLLLSADTVVAGFTPNLEQGMAAVSAELQQLIHNAPVFQSVVPGVLETQGTGPDAVESSPTVEQILDVSVDIDATTK